MLCERPKNKYIQVNIWYFKWVQFPSHAMIVIIILIYMHISRVEGSTTIEKYIHTPLAI